MEIVRLSETSVKILVSNKEMENLDISFEILKTNEFKAKLFFSALFSALGEQFNNKAYVEVFDVKDQGCVIYISQIISKTNKKREKTKGTITFETKKPEKLKSFSSKLLGLDIDNVKSRLFTNGEDFRLVVEFEKKLPASVKKLCEESFPTAVFGNVLPEITSEHNETWCEVISQNALGTLNGES